jgi:acyl carrier protein
VIASTPTIERLRSLPMPEREPLLESIVVAEFQTVLLMTDDEELPFGESYFDLGLTSLGLTDIKERLEAMLGLELSSTVLFNKPTVEQLMDYLTTELLAELFSAPADAASSTADEQGDLWDDVLQSLYDTG